MIVFLFSFDVFKSFNEIYKKTISSIKLLAFHFTLMPLGNIWIHLFSTQL